MTEIKQNYRSNSVTISVKSFFEILWKEKMVFIIICIFFVSYGIYTAFTTREEFISEGKMLPEIQSKATGLGQFAGLASLAGVDLGSAVTGTDAIRPDLYPDVIESTPFFLALFNSKVRTRENKELTFEDFYFSFIEKRKERESVFLKKFPVKESGILILNRLTEIRLKDLRLRIKASIDKKTGLISLSSKMPDPVVAADVTKFAMQYLTTYITDYRVSKIRNEVIFLEQRVATSRGKFYNNQERKALYSDQFQAPTIRLQRADVQRERLESEYRLSSSFYNELLKKLEEAKIRLQQETPIFKILEPPVAPTLKSEPKKAFIILGWTFLGGIFALFSVLIRKGNYKKIFLEY